MLDAISAAAAVAHHWANAVAVAWMRAARLASTAPAHAISAWAVAAPLASGVLLGTGYAVSPAFPLF